MQMLPSDLCAEVCGGPGKSVPWGQGADGPG